DQSGLEKLYMQVNARLPQRDLLNLRNKLKTMSHAGLQFKIETIDFQPSLVEVEQARQQLRQQVYQQVSKELKQLNADYPNQRYFLHNV
ncbi:hypothetical protein GN156_30190, partial [bacterium LRH843]|nr:hypothetical protein [bacterium LRH843]